MWLRCFISGKEALSVQLIEMQFVFVSCCKLANSKKRLLQRHWDVDRRILARQQRDLPLRHLFSIILKKSLNVVGGKFLEVQQHTIKQDTLLLQNFVTTADGNVMLFVAVAMDRTLRSNCKNLRLLVVTTRLIKGATPCHDAMIICKTTKRVVNN